MKCVEACSYGALEIVGKPYSVEAVIDEVERDKPFYNNSGGGMTLSGGEPAAHVEYARALLKGAKERGLHTCLDTSGHCAWEVFKSLVDFTDIVLFDVKHLDPVTHLKKVGVSNKGILHNLFQLSKTGTEIWVRIPVVPEYNDSIEYHARTAEFLAGLPGRISRVDLIPFHNWCQDKYGWLGIDWELKDVEALDPGFVEIYTEPYMQKGFRVTVGGSGFEEITR